MYSMNVLFTLWIAVLACTYTVGRVQGAAFGPDARYIEVFHRVEKRGEPLAADLSKADEEYNPMEWTLRGTVFLDPAFLRRSTALATASTNGAASMYLHGSNSSSALVDTLEKVRALSDTHEQLAGRENLRVSKDSIKLAKQIRKLLQDSQPSTAEVKDFVFPLINTTGVDRVLDITKARARGSYDNVLWAADPSFVYNVRIVVKDIGSVLAHSESASGNVNVTRSILDGLPVVSTFESEAPLCLYASAGFRDRLVLHLDESSSVWHVGFSVEASQCAKRHAQHRRLSAKTLVDLHLPQYGARPVLDKTSLASAREAVESAQAQSEDGAINADGTVKTDDRGFIQKYWMYIVPALLVFLFSAVEDPAQAKAPAK